MQENCGIKRDSSVPFSPDAISSVEEATKFSNVVGYPVLIKSAFGGGGRGIAKPGITMN